MPRLLNKPDPQEAAPERRVRSGPTIHVTGSACLTLALSLLALGMVRGELAATLCGFSLLLFLMAAFLGVVVASFWWRAHPVFSSWNNRDSVALRISNPGSSRLGILYLARADYLVRYSTAPGIHGARTFTLAIPLETPETEGHFTRPSRGYYYPEIPAVLVSDYAGLFSWTLPQNPSLSAEPIAIFPEPDRNIRYRLPPGKTGLVSGKSTFNRSEELHETRQYHPGDDPRKINWKVYAHVGALSIREGELLPPPSAEYVCVFNPRKPAPGTGRFGIRSDRLFDVLVNRAAALALDLLHTHHIITVLTTPPGAPVRKTTIHPDDPKAEERLLSELSVPQPVGRGISPKDILRELSDQTVLLLFTLPDNTLLSGDSGFPALKNRLSVYAGPILPPATPDRPLLWFRRLIITEEGRGAKENSGNSVFNVLAEQLCLSLEREGIHAQTL